MSAFASPSMSAVGAARAQVWRKSVFVRVLGAAGSLLLSATALSIVVRLVAGEANGLVAGNVAGVAILAAGAVAVWCFAFRPMLEADDQGIRIRNVFGGHRLRWDEIREFRTDQLGLKFRRVDGKPMVGASVFATTYFQVPLPPQLPFAPHDRRAERAAEYLRQWSAGSRPDDAMLLPTDADRRRSKLTNGVFAAGAVLYGLAELYDRLA